MLVANVSVTILISIYYVVNPGFFHPSRVPNSMGCWRPGSAVAVLISEPAQPTTDIHCKKNMLPKAEFAALEVTNDTHSFHAPKRGSANVLTLSFDGCFTLQMIHQWPQKMW